MPLFFKNKPHLIAMIVPKLLFANTEINWLAKKQMRKNGAIVFISFVIIANMSLNSLIEPVIFPYT